MMTKTKNGYRKQILIDTEEEKKNKKKYGRFNIRTCPQNKYIKLYQKKYTLNMFQESTKKGMKT